MIFKFTIIGRLNGSNEIKAANRSHWSKGAKMAKEDKEFCAWSIRLAKNFDKARFSKGVRVSFVWIEPNGKRDLDNILGGQKAILDALVACSVLANDTRKQVAELVHAFPSPDKQNPTIEVTISDEIEI